MFSKLQQYVRNSARTSTSAQMLTTPLPLQPPANLAATWQRQILIRATLQNGVRPDAIRDFEGDATKPLRALSHSPIARSGTSGRQSNYSDGTLSRPSLAAWGHTVATVDCDGPRHGGGEPHGKILGITITPVAFRGAAGGGCRRFTRDVGREWGDSSGAERRLTRAPGVLRPRDPLRARRVDDTARRIVLLPMDSSRQLRTLLPDDQRKTTRVRRRQATSIAT